MNTMGPILVVEDTPSVLEMIDVTLRFKGYTVVTARNGEEALERIKQEMPALLITDILMPRMDGFSLAYNIRNNPETRALPIIFISATFLTQEDKSFAHSLGAIRYIEKPIDTEDFLLTVAEIMTQGISTIPRPMEPRTFYTGYRERLENKLRYKNTQIARTERLLQTLPETQRPAFESLLVQSKEDRRQIEIELQELYVILNSFEES